MTLVKTTITVYHEEGADPCLLKAKISQALFFEEVVLYWIEAKQETPSVDELMEVNAVNG